MTERRPLVRKAALKGIATMRMLARTFPATYLTQDGDLCPGFAAVGVKEPVALDARTSQHFTFVSKYMTQKTLRPR